MYMHIYFLKASKELSYNLGGKAKWYSHYGKNVWQFIINPNIYLLYDLANTQEKAYAHKKTCTRMFIGTSVRRPKVENSPGSHQNGQTPHDVYSYNGTLLSNEKEITIDIHSNVNESQKHYTE